MTLHIVRVSPLHDFRDAIVGSVTRTVRTGIETPRYALKLALSMNVAEEAYGDDVYEVRDANNNRIFDRVAPIDDCPF